MTGLLTNLAGTNVQEVLRILQTPDPNRLSRYIYFPISLVFQLLNVIDHRELVIIRPVPVLKEDLEERILGGSDAPDGAYPYMVSLRTPNNVHLCGGSIISPNWILTAAHCVQGTDPSDWNVIVGTNYLNAGGIAYKVARIITHDFNRKTGSNDIAVLEVSGSISYNQKVKNIGLATSVLQPGAICTVSGWGVTSYPDGDSPNNLQHINMSAVSIPECQKVPFHLQVTNTNVCAYVAPGKGTCHTDSGGPLVSGDVQVGVVSWGDACALGKPDVFTSVAAYRSWIRERAEV